MRMIDALLRFSYYALFLLTPLIMFPRTSELFEFNKMLFIYFMTAVVITLWAIKMILTQKGIFKKTLFYYPITAFLASEILSTLFSIDMHTSIFGYYGRFNGGLLSIFAFIILFAGFISNFNKEIIRKLLGVSLLSSFLVMVWAIPGKLGHDLTCLVFTGDFSNACWTNQFDPAARAFSTLGQPNWLGAFLAINFFIGLYFLYTVRKEFMMLPTLYWKIILVAYTVLNFAFILFTRSRSTLISVLLCFALFPLFLLFRNGFKFDKKQFKYIGIVGILLIGAVLWYKTGITQVDKYITLSTYFPQKVVQQTSQKPAQPAVQNNITESGDIRRIVWKGALQLGNMYPILGTGVETFAYSYYFVRPQEHNLTSEWDYLYNKAHNEYLNFFATTGYTGLIVYSILIISIIVLGLKSYLSNKNTGEKNEANTDNEVLIVCLLLSFFTILITNFFGFSTTTINLFFYLIPAFFLIMYKNQAEVVTNDTKNAKKERPLPRNSMVTAVGIFVSSIFLIFCSWYLLNYFLADINYGLGDNYAKVGQYQVAYTYLDSALKMRKEHVYEDRMSFTAANLAYAAAYNKDTQLAQQLVNLANQTNDDSIKASPENVLYYKTRAKNQFYFYQISLNSQFLVIGLNALDKARELSPTDPKIPYTAALLLSTLEDEEKDVKIKEQDKQKSLTELQRAIDLKPNYRDAYFLKGQLYKKYGDTTNARKMFEACLKMNSQDAEAQKELSSL